MLFDCLLASPGKSQPLVSLTSLYQWSVLSLWILLNSCCLCCSLQSRSCCPFLYVIIFGSWCASYGCMLMFSITSGKLCVNVPLPYSVFSLWNSYQMYIRPYCSAISSTHYFRFFYLPDSELHCRDFLQTCLLIPTWCLNLFHVFADAHSWWLSFLWLWSFLFRMSYLVGLNVWGSWGVRFACAFLQKSFRFASFGVLGYD